MGEKIREFNDGSVLEYNRGSFDEWCVFLTRPGQIAKPPRDIDYFNQIVDYGRHYGNDKVYTDYCKIYDVTEKSIDSGVFKLIDDIASGYDNEHSLEVAIVFSVLYMAMIAEERKANTKLGKRIKRLGIHAILKEKMDIYRAANFMKGMKWRDIDQLCKVRGF